MTSFVKVQLQNTERRKGGILGSTLYFGDDVLIALNVLMIVSILESVIFSKVLVSYVEVTNGLKFTPEGHKTVVNFESSWLYMLQFLSSDLQV
jgi:hypothetical protein